MIKFSLALRFHLEDTTFKRRIDHCKPNFSLFTTTDTCQYLKVFKYMKVPLLYPPLNTIGMKLSQTPFKRKLEGHVEEGHRLAEEIHYFLSN